MTHDTNRKGLAASGKIHFESCARGAAQQGVHLSDGLHFYRYSVDSEEAISRQNRRIVVGSIALHHPVDVTHISNLEHAMRVFSRHH